VKIWLIEIILAGYVFLRLVLPQKKWKWYFKWSALLVVLYAAGGLHLGIHLSRAGFAGSGAFAFCSAFSYAVIFTFFLLLILTDALRVALIPVMLLRKKRWNFSFRWQANKIHLVLLGLALVLSLVGIRQGLAMPQIKHYSIPVKGLPKAADGTRIVLLADLHVGHLAGRERIQKIVDITNSLHPHTVLIAGDFVDGPVEKRRGDLEPLGQLRSPWGTYGVSGNHEYYSDYEAWKKVFRELNITMLENAHVTIHGVCTIAGVTYRQSDLSLALRGREPALPVILVRHAPMYADAAAKRGVAIQLSGHTHGGMILGVDWLVAAMNDGFLRGIYGIGDMTLIVNSGTNIWSGFPVRLGVSAEISVITLHPASHF